MFLTLPEFHIYSGLILSYHYPMVQAAISAAGEAHPVEIEYGGLGQALLPY